MFIQNTGTGLPPPECCLVRW